MRRCNTRGYYVYCIRPDLTNESVFQSLHNLSHSRGYEVTKNTVSVSCAIFWLHPHQVKQNRKPHVLVSVFSLATISNTLSETPSPSICLMLSFSDAPAVHSWPLLSASPYGALHDSVVAEGVSSRIRRCRGYSGDILRREERILFAHVG